MATKLKNLEESDYDLLEKVESAGADWREILRKQLVLLQDRDKQQRAARKLVAELAEISRPSDGVTDLGENHDYYLYGWMK